MQINNSRELHAFKIFFFSFLFHIFLCFLLMRIEMHFCEICKRRFWHCNNTQIFGEKEVINSWLKIKKKLHKSFAFILLILLISTHSWIRLIIVLKFFSCLLKTTQGKLHCIASVIYSTTAFIGVYMHKSRWLPCLVFFYLFYLQFFALVQFSLTSKARKYINWTILSFALGTLSLLLNIYSVLNVSWDKNLSLCKKCA